MENKLYFDKNISEDSIDVDNTITLLSASEAYQKTVDNIKNCYTKELAEINKRIEDAITDGKFSINGDGYLQRETIQRLRELGYEIKTDSQYNEPLWKISWR